MFKEQDSLSGSGRERQIYLKKEEMLKKMQCSIERKRCRICGKKIDPVPVNEKMLDEATSTIDKICDLIKIGLNFREDKDVQVANTVSDFQYTIPFIRDKYINLYPLFRTENSDETDEDVEKEAD